MNPLYWYILYGFLGIALTGLILYQFRKKIFISNNCNPQTIDLIKTRTNPFGLELIIGDEKKELTKISDEIGRAHV